jgi:hypothetical protein
MNDNTKLSGFAKLDAYLDRTGEDLFSEKAIDLQIEALREVEGRGIAAIIAASKKALQVKVGQDVTVDIFTQGMKLIQKINFLCGFLAVLRMANDLIGDKFKIKVLQSFASEKVMEIMDDEDSLCKLMRTILHDWKSEDSG